MVDKNLFLYDLSVVAILKNEGSYLKEWLDYHLLAGVDHFYLYDNDSPDNQAEVAAPYVKAGLVDYFPLPGKAMQYVAYNDAFKRFKFFSRYMAFIDGDEFIYPKTNRPIAEVVDEILSVRSNAAGLAIHWHIFGSNGHETADYSRGVLERFTRRAPEDCKNNEFIKTIADPRKINYFREPHLPDYFELFCNVDENLNTVLHGLSSPILTEKIVVNHYHCKSREEYALKNSRGDADKVRNDKYTDEMFNSHDHNEEFDDGILHYRAARAEIFSLEDNAQRHRRVLNALVETLSTFAAEEPSPGKLETALICRALSTYLREKFPDLERMKLYEEASLGAIIKSFVDVPFGEMRLFINDLPNLLTLPYPAAKELRTSALGIIPQMMDIFRINNRWKDYVDLERILDILKLVKV